MAHVIVQVNGRPYTMQCPEGEEDHLRELAELLERQRREVQELATRDRDHSLLPRKWYGMLSAMRSLDMHQLEGAGRDSG